MRVGVVDLGTNSTRLLVADVDDGRVADIERDTQVTRLGEGVDERRRLLPVPIARVRNTLSDFRRTLEQLGAERTLAIATSAIAVPSRNPSRKIANPSRLRQYSQTKKTPVMRKWLER